MPRPTWLRPDVRVLALRLVDLSYGLAVAAIGWAGSDGPNAWSPFPQPLAVGAGVVGGAALWWRRSNPDRVALATVASAALSANPLPALPALFTAGQRRLDARLAGVIVAATLAFALPGWLDDGFHPTAIGLLGGFALAAVPIGSGMYVETRRAAVQSAEERASLAELDRERRAQEARLAERARIAREMHDVLAHKVSLIALHAGALEVNPRSDPAEVSEDAAVIRRAAAEALDELRLVLGVLREDDGEDRLTPQPGYDDIAALVDASRAAGVPVSTSLDPPALPPTTSRNAYRVVQEALTNVHKHAAGALTEVTVTGDEAAGVTVTVTNGPGTPLADLPGAGSGLVGLRERVRLIGGTLDHGPQPDGGWRLVAWLPWSGAADPAAGAAARPGLDAAVGAP